MPNNYELGGGGGGVADEDSVRDATLTCSIASCSLCLSEAVSIFGGAKRRQKSKKINFIYLICI